MSGHFLPKSSFAGREGCAASLIGLGCGELSINADFVYYKSEQVAQVNVTALDWIDNGECRRAYLKVQIVNKENNIFAETSFILFLIVNKREHAYCRGPPLCVARSQITFAREI